MAEQHKSDDLRKGVKTTKKGEFEKIKKGEIMFFQRQKELLQAILLKPSYFK